jgi:tRNA G10  N-methylase Trm11
MTERNRRDIEKVYKEFFYQTKFVLKSKGIIVMAFDTETTLSLVEKYAAEYKFKTLQKRVISQGKKELKVIVIQK